jgi:hypothetical protein
MGKLLQLNFILCCFILASCGQDKVRSFASYTSPTSDGKITCILSARSHQIGDGPVGIVASIRYSASTSNAFVRINHIEFRSEPDGEVLISSEDEIIAVKDKGIYAKGNLSYGASHIFSEKNIPFADYTVTCDIDVIDAEGEVSEEIKLKGLIKRKTQSRNSFVSRF